MQRPVRGRPLSSGYDGTGSSPERIRPKKASCACISVPCAPRVPLIAKLINRCRSTDKGDGMRCTSTEDAQYSFILPTHRQWGGGPLLRYFRVQSVRTAPLRSRQLESVQRGSHQPPCLTIPRPSAGPFRVRKQSRRAELPQPPHARRICLAVLALPGSTNGGRPDVTTRFGV